MRITSNQYLVDSESGCWNWLGTLYQISGYARISRRKYAHVEMYKQVHCDYNSALVVDHLCNNRKCINPKHLEQKTQRANVLRGTAPTAINARKTHCINGHPLSGTNLHIYVTKGIHRYCKLCRAEAHERWKLKKKGISV